MKGVLPFYDNLNSLSDWFNWKSCVSVVLTFVCKATKEKQEVGYN